MFFILFLLNVLGCSGFVPHPIGVNYVSVLRNPDLLSSWAKASKKKSGKKPAAVSPGGFGKVADTAKEVDDFAAFPALETKVAETLVPSPPEWLEAGGLPAEVYDRLEQIHGFRNFNYETSEEGSTGDESISFDDLISSTGRGASSSDNSKSSLSDGDFGDLLAAATGASVETPKVPEDSTMDSISSLPPFSDFRVVHVDPLVLAIDDFFTEEECDRYVTMSTAPANSKTKDAPFQTRSMTVGKDALAKSQRTSTTWFHHYKNVPELMAKASRLLGLDGIDRWEEPQTVRCVRFIFMGFGWPVQLSWTNSVGRYVAQKLSQFLAFTGIVAAKSSPGTSMRCRLTNQNHNLVAKERQP
jgi:hypothetical protein